MTRLLAPGRWLLRRALGGTRGRASAPCVPARAAALPEEKPGRRLRLLNLLVSVASQGNKETQGASRVPGRCAPAASRAAPPRGDEAPAVKMEVTCLLLLALIPFHCRGQGVYGKSLRPTPR